MSACGARLRITVSKPPLAKDFAIPRPMTPDPTTITFRIFRDIATLPFSLGNYDNLTQIRERQQASPKNRRKSKMLRIKETALRAKAPEALWRTTDKTR